MLSSGATSVAPQGQDTQEAGGLTARQYLAQSESADAGARPVGSGSIEQICNDFGFWGQLAGEMTPIERRILALQRFEAHCGQGTVERLIFDVALNAVSDDDEVKDFMSRPRRMDADKFLLPTLTALQIMASVRGYLPEPPIDKTRSRNIATVAFEFARQPEQWIAEQISREWRPDYPEFCEFTAVPESIAKERIYADGKRLLGRGTVEQITGDYSLWAYEAIASESTTDRDCHAMRTFDKGSPGCLSHVVATTAPGGVLRHPDIRNFLALTSKDTAIINAQKAIAAAVNKVQMMIAVRGQVPRVPIGQADTAAFKRDPYEWARNCEFKAELPAHDLSIPRTRPRTSPGCG